MHSTPHERDLTTGPAAESATQLTLTTPNHAAVQHRIRDLLTAVKAVTGPSGRPRYAARHLELMTWLALYADRAGVARISVAQLARELERDEANVRREVRALAAGGFVTRRPDPTRTGYFQYVIPAMESPVRGL